MNYIYDDLLREWVGRKEPRDYLNPLLNAALKTIPYDTSFVSMGVIHKMPFLSKKPYDVIIIVVPSQYILLGYLPKMPEIYRTFSHNDHELTARIISIKVYTDLLIDGDTEMWAAFTTSRRPYFTTVFNRKIIFELRSNCKTNQTIQNVVRRANKIVSSININNKEEVGLAMFHYLYAMRMWDNAIVSTPKSVLAYNNNKPNVSEYSALYGYEYDNDLMMKRFDKWKNFFIERENILRYHIIEPDVNKLSESVYLLQVIHSKA